MDNSFLIPKERGSLPAFAKVGSAITAMIAQYVLWHTWTREGGVSPPHLHILYVNHYIYIYIVYIIYSQLDLPPLKQNFWLRQCIYIYQLLYIYTVYTIYMLLDLAPPKQNFWLRQWFLYMIYVYKKNILLNKCYNSYTGVPRNFVWGGPNRAACKFYEQYIYILIPYWVALSVCLFVRPL